MPRRTEEKYPLTIYELDNSVELKDYRRILREKIKAQKQKQLKDSGIRTPDADTELYFFSYTNNVDSQDIGWHKTWQSIFTIDEPLVRNSRTGHGVIIIHLKRLEKKFALIFGRSFSLLKEYYVRDFGISLATRLFDSNTVEVVSSKYFSMIKNKQIIDYKDEYSLQADEGQAVDFLQARITEDYERRNDPNNQIINQFLNKVKPDASAGYSFVKVTLYGNIITLPLIINALVDLAAIQQYQERFELPIMQPVNKAMALELDRMLLRRILTEEEEFTISVPFFGFDDNDRFAFFDDIEGYRLQYGERIETFNGKLDKQEIETFILEHGDYIDEIRDLQVSVLINGEYRAYECLLRWIDAELNIGAKSYVLYDGEWVGFNQVYFDYLTRSVEKYERECAVYLPQLSFSNQEATYYRQEFHDQLIERFYRNGTGSIDEVYREFVYNFALSQKENWLLFDRCFGNGIEICDIYVSNDQYVHVKIGDSTALDEVLRQSVMGLRFAEQNRHHLNDYTDFEGNPIAGAETCAVIFLTTSNTREIPSIAGIRSLKCKMTFVDWVVFTKERMKLPKIYIGHFTDENVNGFVLHDNLREIALN